MMLRWSFIEIDNSVSKKDVLKFTVFYVSQE